MLTFPCDLDNGLAGGESEGRKSGVAIIEDGWWQSKWKGADIFMRY